MRWLFCVFFAVVSLFGPDLSCRGDWVVWPAGLAVPEGAQVRVDAGTGQQWVNITTDELDAKWRASVNAATAAEDTAQELTPREAMISALKKLPSEEVGGLDLDAASDDDLAELWDQRQQELVKFSEQLTESAAVLKERILVLEAFAAGDAVEADVLAALVDLEYELGDVDNAKDFHDSLKGFGALTRLLGAEFGDQVRAEAAKCVGTCVKNEATYQLWPAQGEEPTALKQLVEMLDGGSTDLRRAALYALGATLRQNDGDVLRLFARRYDGVRALVKAAGAAVGEVSAAERPGPAWTVLEKLVTLVADLLAEARTEDLGAIEVWCHVFRAAIDVAPANRKAEKVLLAATAIRDQCDWSPVASKLTDLARDLRALQDLDPDFREELALSATTLLDPTPTKQRQTTRDQDPIQSLPLLT